MVLQVSVNSHAALEQAGIMGLCRCSLLLAEAAHWQAQHGLPQHKEPVLQHGHLLRPALQIMATLQHRGLVAQAMAVQLTHLTRHCR